MPEDKPIPFYTQPDGPDYSKLLSAADEDPGTWQKVYVRTTRAAIRKLGRATLRHVESYQDEAWAAEGKPREPGVLLLPFRMSGPHCMCSEFPGLHDPHGGASGVL